LFSCILVGTDGSETATRAVGQALGLARSLGARLEVVSSYAPVPAGRLRAEVNALPAQLQWMPNAREEVDAILAEAIAQAKAEDLQVVTHARQGDPADAILDVAEERGADLIVIGNKGMTGAKRFLLGSVPNKVSHHAPCSVLIIRTV